VGKIADGKTKIANEKSKKSAKGEKGIWEKREEKK
jgi:hypothetical protein